VPVNLGGSDQINVDSPQPTHPLKNSAPSLASHAGDATNPANPAQILTPFDEEHTLSQSQDFKGGCGEKRAAMNKSPFSALLDGISFEDEEEIKDDD
jgi:hypothetical protein